MSKLLILGNNRLNGRIKIHGAKNSALPILAATVLCKKECVLHNCPILSDISVALEILKHLGAKVKTENHDIIINAKDINQHEIPKELMVKMRSSIIFLGPILARTKKAKVFFPGGCELGPRPIDLHLKSLKQLNIKVKECSENIECSSKKITPATIILPFPSVGATENIVLTSVLTKGTTKILNAAQEPEIADLTNFLNKAGAKIFIKKEGSIIIEGVKNLDGAEYSIMPDRIATTTYISAAATTGSSIVIEDICMEHLKSTISIFNEMNVKIILEANKIKVIANKKLKSAKIIKTMPYPGFPTDSQAIIMAVACFCEGTTTFVENIFQSRFKHVKELIKMGAEVEVFGKTAVVKGQKYLRGATVKSYDLRGAAAMVAAGLGANGTTILSSLTHLDRGYENIEKNLISLGASVKRID
ncbi:MAG: UDP-N-acetylglucosamine 1-carboxyvinyltransferase [Oscillospiraceae bacterium]|jgi:UDP-N-acetylglucosamine 1-carboxyvinyltransferase|nr:UDP-N-acetylglucosamine 1-carboxyvinyltransferase [Oscillospiraceae bacterium]